MIVKTGIRRAFDVAMTLPMADIIVLSPPTNSACAPREASDRMASLMAALPSMFASSSVIPSALHDSRVFMVKASEFDSAGFHAMPTRASDGSAFLASTNASFTGRNEP